eukprot:COSAG02_NODE_580_length_20059_cov_3.703908_9_plen_1076_part_00
MPSDVPPPPPPHPPRSESDDSYGSDPPPPPLETIKPQPKPEGSDSSPPPPLYPVGTKGLSEPEPEPEPEGYVASRSPAQPLPPPLARLLELDRADDPGAVTVTFTAPGPLGIKFVEHCGNKVVDRITPGNQAGQKPELQPGMLLHSVQGILTNALPMGEVAKLLQQRPVAVSFLAQPLAAIAATTGEARYHAQSGVPDGGHAESVRSMELSAQARLSTEQALSRLVLHARGTGLHDLGASATAALEFLLLHGAACLQAGPVHALEMLLEPLLYALTTTGSAEIVALVLPAIHRLLPYVGGAMLDAQIPTAEGFPFLVAVIESLAEGVSCAISFHGVGVLLHQLLHALSLVFDMMAPHHLSRDTLSMLVLALFRLMLRASLAPPTPAGANVGSLPLSELVAPTEALFQRLGAITFRWLADTTTPIPVSSAATASKNDGKVNWVQLEESLSRFVSQPPAGSPGLLGDGVLTDATVEGWLSAMSIGASPGRPALQLIAALGKLMMFEMPEPVTVGGASSSVLLARQQAVAAGLFGTLLTGDLAVQMSRHPLCLQIIRRHGMVGLLHAATPAASAVTGNPNSRPDEASAQYGLLAAVSLAVRRICCSVWLEETGLLGEELGAVLGALVKVTLPPVLASEPTASLGNHSFFYDCITKLALEQLWLPLMQERHKGGADRLVILSLFARHDLPHAETLRLFGEPSLLISKQLIRALCALAARGGVFGEQQDRPSPDIAAAGPVAFECLCRLVEEIHAVVFTERGLVQASQEEGGGGAALAAWKMGFERCVIWDRVRSMLADGRNEAALHLTALHMLDEKRPRSKLNDDEHRAQILSWWMLSKAYACQLEVREVLTLVEKQLIEVGRSDTVEAECFRRLQRRPLLPVVRNESGVTKPRNTAQESGLTSPAYAAQGPNVLVDFESESSDDESPEQDDGFDDDTRAHLVAVAARQAALGTAAVRCGSTFRRHRGLPPGPLSARQLVVLETETSAGVSLALFASVGTSIAAAITEATSRFSRQDADSMWLRPAALKCLQQSEQLARCVIEVEESFLATHESTHGLRKVTIYGSMFQWSCVLMFASC